MYLNEEKGLVLGPKSLLNKYICMVELGMVHNLLYCLSHHHHHNQMDYLMLISTMEIEAGRNNWTGMCCQN